MFCLNIFAVGIFYNLKNMPVLIKISSKKLNYPELQNFSQYLFIFLFKIAVVLHSARATVKHFYASKIVTNFAKQKLIHVNMTHDINYIFIKKILNILLQFFA